MIKHIDLFIKRAPIKNILDINSKTLLAHNAFRTLDACAPTELGKPFEIHTKQQFEIEIMLIKSSNFTIVFDIYIKNSCKLHVGYHTSGTFTKVQFGTFGNL